MLAAVTLRSITGGRCAPGRRLQPEQAGHHEPAMTRADTPAFFDCCCAGAAELLDAGAGMDVIQATIEAYALDREEKDALWLWAHGRHDRLIGDRLDRQIVGRHSCGELGTESRPDIRKRVGHD